MIPLARMLQYGGTASRKIKKMSSGQAHFVLLSTDNNLYGSGANGGYQFGYSNAASYNNQWVTVLNGVENVWAASAYTIIRKTDGTLWHTGLGFKSLTTTGGFVQFTTAELNGIDTSTITNIYGALGVIHVVVNDTRVYTMGYNPFGQTGLNVPSNTAVTVLTEVTALNRSNPIKEICYTYSGGSTFVRYEDGAVYCFGNNLRGELNKGNTTQVLTPSRWHAANFKLLMAGSDGVVAVPFNTNALFICGNSQYGQLGNGYTSSTISNVTTVVSVSTSATVGTSDAIIPTRGAGTQNNAFIVGTGVWVTGQRPSYMGATGVTDATVLGSFTRYNIPIAFSDIKGWSSTGVSSNLYTEDSLYQTGWYTQIIDKTDTASQAGFIKVRLPWE